jgi:hypothetical protein
LTNQIDIDKDRDQTQIEAHRYRRIAIFREIRVKQTDIGTYTQLIRTDIPEDIVVNRSKEKI